MRFSCFPWLLSFCAFGLMALAGCGNSPAVGPCIQVKGKVTLAGKPLAGGAVAFIPLEAGANSPRPEGDIDANGFYSLRTGGKEGAPAGKYRATLTTSGVDKTQDSQFNPVYSHWEKSPLIVLVRENAPAGAYDLKLKPR
jgi:hypothetical protein